MLAVIPKTFAWLTLILVPTSIFAGWFTDRFLKKPDRRIDDPCEGLILHGEEHCVCFDPATWIRQLKSITPLRGLLSAISLVILVALILGLLGPQQWNWVRITLLVVSSAVLFIVVTVPEHFLEEHLWKHVVVKHLPRIFFWTFGTLLFLMVLESKFELSAWMAKSQLIVLIAALLVGLIPESGPHMVFITLYSQEYSPSAYCLQTLPFRMDTVCCLCSQSRARSSSR